MSFDGLLNQRCNIEKNTPTQDTSGQEVESWGIIASQVKCRFEPKGGGRVVGPQAIYEKASHVLYMRARSGLTLKTDIHRIDVAGEKYTILSVSVIPGKSYTSHFELLLEKVE